MQGARGEPSRRRGRGRPPARKRLCSVSFLRLGFPFSLCVCSCLLKGTGKAEPSLQPPQLRGQPRAPHPRPYSVSLCWEGAAEPLLDPVPLTGLQPCGSFGRRATRSHPSFPVCVSVTASSGRGEGGIGRSGLCPNTRPEGEHWFGFLSPPWCPSFGGRVCRASGMQPRRASPGSTVLPRNGETVGPG